MGDVPHFCPILTQNPLDHEAFQILPHSFRWQKIGYLNALQHGVRSPLMGDAPRFPVYPICLPSRAHLVSELRKGYTLGIYVSDLGERFFHPREKFLQGGEKFFHPP